MITLESTKIAFDTWRKTRVNTAVPIPMELWGMVSSLLSTHKKSEICKALHLSGGQIKRYCSAGKRLTDTSLSKRKATQQSAKTKASTDGGFVAVTPVTTTIEPSTSELTLKGDSRSLHISLPTSALSQVLPLLGGLL